MSTGSSQKRTRSERVASVELPPGYVGRAWHLLQRGDVLGRLGLCLLAAMIMLAVTRAWVPPFPYRAGYVPPRDIVPSVTVKKENKSRTEELRIRASDQATYVYDQDRKPLENFREALFAKLAALADAKDYERIEGEWLAFLTDEEIAEAKKVRDANEKAWDEAVKKEKERAEKAQAEAEKLRLEKEKAEKERAGKEKEAEKEDEDATEEPKDEAAEEVKASDTKLDATPAEKEDESKADEAVAEKPPIEPADDLTKPKLPPRPIDPLETKLREFQKLIAGEDKLKAIERSLRNAFVDIEQQGFFEKPEHGAKEGNQAEITVQPLGDPTNQSRVKIPDLLYEKVKENLKAQMASELPQDVSDRGFRWLSKQLDALKPRATLRLNKEQTELAKDRAAEDVKAVTDDYVVGSGRPLAKAGEPLDANSLELLRLEYDARLEKLKVGQMLFHLVAALGMYIALYTLCGFYIHFREPHLLKRLSQFCLMLGCVTLVVCFSVLLARWESEIIVLLIFGMCMALAYQRELALLLSAAVALLIVISLGLSLGTYVTFMASAATVVLMLGRIRSRSKLIYVGLAAGVVAFLTDVGVSTLENQPLTWAQGFALLEASAWMGLRAMMAAAIMAVILPLVEALFGVQTDLSLLELGDQSHPLLQELVRRAPGTYNHSINVASIAEAAAESIGAHGLLVRVGAYFHDIGKMLKPGYFVENQADQANRHDTLMPAMSTLIIIAHVKDGADLARQHHLPQPIIDMIQQHHGTTLVEYFYREASKQSEARGEGQEVDESTYRYPGPKPQTKEAGVMMLSDVAESACRTLVDPGPARIESLVHDLTMARLMDGQLSESGLTLEEVRTVEDSIVKSLTAVYHGRIKYTEPAQETA